MFPHLSRLRHGRLLLLRGAARAREAARSRALHQQNLIRARRRRRGAAEVQTALQPVSGAGTPQLLIRLSEKLFIGKREAKRWSRDLQRDVWACRTEQNNPPRKRSTGERRGESELTVRNFSRAPPDGFGPRTSARASVLRRASSRLRHQAETGPNRTDKERRSRHRRSVGCKPRWLGTREGRRHQGPVGRGPTGRTRRTRCHGGSRGARCGTAPSGR